jgi:hypothetical protein
MYLSKNIIPKRILTIVTLFMCHFKTFFLCKTSLLKQIERLVLSFVYCCISHNDVRTRKSIDLATTVGTDIVLEFQLNVSRSHTRALSACLCLQIISTPAK